jgi:hypothetical protein
MNDSKPFNECTAYSIETVSLPKHANGAHWFNLQPRTAATQPCGCSNHVNMEIRTKQPLYSGAIKHGSVDTSPGRTPDTAL